MNSHRLAGASIPIVVALLGGMLAAPAGVGAAEATRTILAAAVPGPTVDLLIGARPGHASDVAALSAEFGTLDQGAVRGLPVSRLRVPAADAVAIERTLRTDAAVDFVEVDGTAALMLEPNDPLYGPTDEWGLPLIGAPAAWDTTTGTDGPIVAVVDTGVDATHPDLAGRVLPGIDLVNDDADATDDNGHGTHVSGIIAAAGGNGIGGAGVCWGCRILPVKALDAYGSGFYSTLASGITWATDHGAQVINLSLGGSSPSDTLAAAVVYAQQHGVVVVAAAGNNDVSTPFYPAAFDGVVAVGAMDQTRHRETFSNFGTGWVDLAAGGCSESTWLGGGYESLCGTSMATPFVAGSLGLLLAADPDATPAQAEAALEATAGPDGNDWTTHGLVHLDRAMAVLLGLALAPTPTPTPTPAPTPTATPAPVVSTPVVLTVSASLARVPRSISVTTLAGSGSIALANPHHVRLVVTLKRGNVVVWHGSTRTGKIRWSFHLRTGAYTVTVTRPGFRGATGSVTVSYHRR